MSATGLLLARTGGWVLTPDTETASPPWYMPSPGGWGTMKFSRCGNNRGPQDSVCQVTDLVGPPEAPRGVPVTMAGGRGPLLRVIVLRSKGR